MRPLLATACTPLLLLVACGGGDDGPLTVTALSEEIQDESDGEIPADVADCIAQTIADEIGDEELETLSVDDLEGGEAPSPEFEAAFDTAFDACLFGDAGGDEEGDDADDLTGMEQGDVAATMPPEVCDAWTAWEQTGDEAELATIRDYTDGWRDDISEAIDFLTSDPPTDTPEDQQVFEGNVDFVRAELQIGGCTDL